MDETTRYYVNIINNPCCNTVLVCILSKQIKFEL